MRMPFVFRAIYLIKKLNAEGVTHLSPGFVQALDKPWVIKQPITKKAEGVQQKAAPFFLNPFRVLAGAAVS